MGSNWKEGKLEELAIIEMGQSPLGETCNQEGIGTPLLNGPTEFGGYHPIPVQFTTAARKFSTLNDILFCVRGSTTGRMNWADQKYAIGRGIAAMRHRSGSEYRYFLKALIDLHLNKLLASATGSTFPNVSREQLANLDCEIPPLPEQRLIAEILGALEDKIELNRRMNATLESMAWAVFRQWFVDFDIVQANSENRLISNMKLETAALFPDKFIDSQLGQIPLGWRIVPLYEVCKRITDGSHNSPKSVENGYPMASVKDMHKWGFNLATCRQISESDYLELVRNDCRPLQGDVLIAKDGSYLKHIFVVEKDLDLVVLSSIAILRPNEKVNPHFLALTLKSPTTLSRMENYVTGAVLQRIVVKDFRRFPILLPPGEIQMAWANFITPMIQKCWKNMDEINTLVSLRDSLLPKLMRGEVRVKDI